MGCQLFPGTDYRIKIRCLFACLLSGSYFLNSLISFALLRNLCWIKIIIHRDIVIQRCLLGFRPCQLAHALQSALLMRQVIVPPKYPSPKRMSKALTQCALQTVLLPLFNPTMGSLIITFQSTATSNVPIITGNVWIFTMAVSGLKSSRTFF